MQAGVSGVPQIHITGDGYESQVAYGVDVWPGGVLTLSLALPASSAVSATIGSGKVKEKFPLVATVPVTFVCPAGAFYNVNLSLFQVQGNVTVTGLYDFQRGDPFMLLIFAVG
jgi:hypothetical protein